ncbi:pyruvate dehydrogenase protein x component [Durotheca rogersii]|uniref:pyruvate dehydrogenase protein x component n=1 Tax=Durotheca rogersii TaxID=419775 RepID=UPI002220A096|nr:pyruvate dehydrogenase protein x component [Durotheca rogersii]KAI5867997.1 pyruvate dehydrogenase protein x component [Durotheca rogersii]
MASFATVARLSARLASRRAAQDAITRGRAGFRTSAAAAAAQNFTMPALSPTMTEGNIASWKLREGDAYSAGDVLLEIETDKATMDVEAQDDGVLVKIVRGDGAKNVQVGTRIGVVADPGDDLAQLELPPDEAPVRKEAQKEEQPPPPPPPPQESREAAPAGTSAEPKKAAGKPPPQKYPLYPSVAHLIKERGLDASVVGEIVATGPSGRLLKGDVLAYLGSVPRARPGEIRARFEHNAHLDLSNIKIAARKAAPAPKRAAPPQKAAPPVPDDVLVSLPVSLGAAARVQRGIADTFAAPVPLSALVARAADAAAARGDLPPPAGRQPTADELFDQVLGLAPPKRQTKRAPYLPQVSALPPPASPAARLPDIDIIDFLAGRIPKPSPRPTTRPPPPGPESEARVLTLTVPRAEERRARVFLERVKTALEDEPGKLFF